MTAKASEYLQESCFSTESNRKVKLLFSKSKVENIHLHIIHISFDKFIVV